MTIRPLVIAPDPRLKQKSEPVREVNEEIKQLAQDMLDTMYHSDGIGLGAVQIGVLKRVIVVDVNYRRVDDRNPTVMVNPEILEFSQDTSCYTEGCLSFPGQYSEVTRPKFIKVKYLDLNGDERIIEADGLFGTCIQHEIDHIDGINFVDHIPAAKRSILMERLRKLKNKK